MAKKIINQFQVKISSCGTNRGNGTYGIWKDKSAFKLLKSVVVHVAKDFVGKENLNSILFMLALDILKGTHKRFDELFPEYAGDKLDEQLKGCFEMKEEAD